MRLRIVAGLVALAFTTSLAAAPARADSFDARRLPDLVALAKDSGQKGELKDHKSGKGQFFDGQDGELFFSMEPVDCAKGQTCKFVFFSANWDQHDITAKQMNGWNRFALSCAGYLDADNSPTLWYAPMVTGHESRADVALHFTRWHDCLGDFGDFLGDPNGFLKENVDGYTP
ncbi:MAG: hypothetical protein JWP35_2853 [Caulobacter sp.]|nr:hypothetical protein [Caulobacter sp.]